jgi:hypothetical protein
MVATLRRLFDDPAAVAEYSHRARDYYVERLRPSARMRRLIDEVLRRRSFDVPFASAVHA